MSVRSGDTTLLVIEVPDASDLREMLIKFVKIPFELREVCSATFPQLVPQHERLR